MQRLHCDRSPWIASSPDAKCIFIVCIFVALSDMRANGTEIPGYDSIGNANASLFPDATIVQWKMQQLWQMSVGSTHKCDVVLHGR
jgi:hypothetical protein